MAGADAAGLAHEALEARLGTDGRELCRALFQDHLDLRALRETRLGGVVDATGIDHKAVESNHQRRLSTIFGNVVVCRMAYRAKGQANLHPADAMLNLGVEAHSHGLRALAALESARGSYEEATQAIERATGVQVGKRQVESLARMSAVDFEAFYSARPVPDVGVSDILIISADGKGIVMRPDALRAGTAKAAAAGSPKLKTRLSKGEKRNRKRMAELAVVYDVAPAPRLVVDILAGPEPLEGPSPPAPVAKAKWLTASVTSSTGAVIAAAFDQAERRDPSHKRTWVALVDGNNHQIARIKAEAKTRGISITVVIDFIHVIEYLWSAAWCFFDEGDARAEAWVSEKGQEVLFGRAALVAGAIRRKATNLGLELAKRAKADECADYLTHKEPYLEYHEALIKGWPIATGVIEGACRHLVRDRFDITGARWSLEGAEAILKLRAIRANGDWTDYWTYHLHQEHRRVHQARYADGIIPLAA